MAITGPFKPGQSGNPGGRTKAQIAIARRAVTLTAEATNDGADIIAFAARVLKGSEPDCVDAKSKRWAADFLANRLWGRAPQVVEVTGQPVDLPDLKGVSTEELRRLAAGEDSGVGSSDDIH